jgi:hypothetical protein
LIQARDEIARHDQRPPEFAAQPFDPAGHIDVAADDREIEPVGGSNIAIGDGAVMKGEPGR